MGRPYFKPDSQTDLTGAIVPVKNAVTPPPPVPAMPSFMGGTMPSGMKDTGVSPGLTGSTSLDGVYYVPSFLPQYSFTSWLTLNQEITAHKMFNLMGHWAMRGVLQKQLNMMFTETPSKPIRIRVVTENGKVDDTSTELEARLKKQLVLNPRVDLFRKMRFSFYDVFGFGLSVYSWLWKRHGNELCLDALVRLPAQTFDYPPIGQPLVFSPILQGVTLARDPKTGLNTGEVEFWQRQSVFNFYPKLLDKKSLFWVKDPVGNDLAGDPLARPIVPLVEMMTYSINKHMQYINRKGAPFMFIKVTNPQGPNSFNGYVGDIDYANQILQYASSDNKYVLRPNMEIVTVDFHDGQGTESVGMKTVQALHQVIVDYFTPKDSVTQNQGASLGSNTRGATDLYYDYIQGMQGWLSREWSRIPQYYIDANGYEGYIATVEFPQTETEASETRLKQGVSGAQLGIADPLQVLKKLDFEVDIDEEVYGEGDDGLKNYLTRNADLWGAINQKIGKNQPNPFGGFGGGATQTATLENLVDTPTLESILKGPSSRIEQDLYADLVRVREQLIKNVQHAAEHELEDE